MMSTSPGIDNNATASRAAIPREKRRVLIVHNAGTITSTVRAVQFRELFARSDSWEAEYISHWSPTLLKWIDRVNRPALPLAVPLLHRPLAAYARWRQRRREAEIVERAAATDLVYIAKVSGLDFYRRLKALGRPKIVADFNDGLWLPYYRNTGWQKLEELLGLVDGVVCENDYVAAFAARHNRRLFIVSDSPQVEVFDRLRDSVRRDDTRVVLGWIGSAENIGHLYRIFEPLEQLFAKHPNLHLRILGARESHIPRFEQVRWSCRPSFGQEDMVREILGCDIGLFPLFHIEDGRARGTLKAKVYMSGECVAACENFGENPKLIRDGENGMLADKPEEWHDKLEWLITHPVERKRIARRGLETIQNEFTAPQLFRRLIGAFDQLVDPADV